MRYLTSSYLFIMSMKNRASNILPDIFFKACLALTIFVIIFVMGVTFFEAAPVIFREGLSFILDSNGMDFTGGHYGIFIYIVDTMVMAALTIIIALPLGLLTAIYLAEYAPLWLSGIMRPMIELLVGIPSVVYGIFGWFILGDFVRDYFKPAVSDLLGFISIFHNNNPQTGRGIFLASIILVIMVLPTIIALSEEALRSVPREHRDSSLSLGATKEETILKIVIPSASGGIISAMVLGLMRAMGETMAVVMLMGNIATIPSSIFDEGYALTSIVLNEITYYYPFDDPRAALFAVVAILFIIEIVFVAVARFVARRSNVHQ